MRTKLLLSLVTIAGCAELDAEDVTVEADVTAAHGLAAEYFRGDLNDPHNLVLARIDPDIDARFGLGAPDPALPADGFQIRWTGALTPRFTERYTLALARVDDTARVIVDGRVIIDHGNLFAPTTGTVDLVAGRRHALVVEYGESWGAAEIALAWQSASQPLEVVPSAQLTPAPTPPAQPAAGPGGRAYPSAACTVTKRAFANDDLSYWVFEPASPAPARAPLVVFDHGWMGNDPVHYAHWLDHLCRRGNVVIFPRYQSLLTPPGFFLPNAAWSVRDALAFLGEPGHVRPQTELGMVVIGHSAGGTVAAGMAGTWFVNGLPFPRAVFAVQPATPDAVPFVGLEATPAATALTCLVGDADTVVGRIGCDALFARTGQVRGKRYVWMRSDGHGAPGLVADHFAPSELTPYTDALDFDVLWRIGDGLRDCAFTGTSCALGPAGAWSDGTPLVAPLVTIDAPPACPAGSTTRGC